MDDDRVPDHSTFLASIAASERAAALKSHFVRETYAGFMSSRDPATEMRKYRDALEKGAVRSAAGERKRMMDDAMRRDPNWASVISDERTAPTAAGGGGIFGGMFGSRSSAANASGTSAVAPSPGAAQRMAGSSAVAAALAAERLAVEQALQSGDDDLAEALRQSMVVSDHDEGGGASDELADALRQIAEMERAVPPTAAPPAAADGNAGGPPPGLDEDAQLAWVLEQSAREEEARRSAAAAAARTPVATPSRGFLGGLFGSSKK